MSDNEWPFGDRGEVRPEPTERAERDGDPADRPRDEARAGEQGWAWRQHEQEERELATSPLPPTTPGHRRTRRARFRRWRRSRPFWGALLALLGGLVIALIPLGAYKIILVAPSVAIASGVGWIVVILAIVSFMTPSQNKLYGLLSVLMGVLAFIASNLGGFLVGSILTIVGGALVFAWAALPPVEQPEQLETRPAPENSRPAHLPVPGEEQPGPHREGVAERSWTETR